MCGYLKSSKSGLWTYLNFTHVWAYNGNLKIKFPKINFISERLKIMREDF